MKISISGHRSLQDPAIIKQELSNTLAYFQSKYGDIEVYSALASGADTLFIEVAKEMNIPYQIVLPFRKERFKQEFEKKEELAKFQGLVKEGNYTVYDNRELSNQDDLSEIYLNAGKQLVDDTNCLVAVWDGEPAQGVGGTADIVAYAETQKKPVYILNGIRENQQDNAVIKEAKALFNKLDESANTFKNKRFKKAWNFGILAGVLAALCLALSVSFKLSPLQALILAFFEFTLLSASFVLLAIYAKKWKERFLLDRRNAEFLRFNLWNYESGISISDWNEEKARPSKEVLDLVSKVAQLPVRFNNLESSKRMAWSLANNQSKYHLARRIEPFKQELHRMHLSLNVLKYSFFGIIVFKLFAELMVYLHINPLGVDLHYVVPYLNFFCILLPPIYAALEGIEYFNQWKRNIAVSEEMVQGLNNIKQDIMNCTEKGQLEKLTENLKDILEIESRDWTVRIKESHVDAKI